MTEFNNQTSPNIHPTVVSPLKLLQFNTKSKLNFFPATSAVNSINAVAARYHMACSNTICVRIFRGGSSVSAPGRGGRRRRAIRVVTGSVEGGRAIAEAFVAVFEVM